MKNTKKKHSKPDREVSKELVSEREVSKESVQLKNVEQSLNQTRKSDGRRDLKERIEFKSKTVPYKSRKITNQGKKTEQDGIKFSAKKITDVSFSGSEEETNNSQDILLKNQNEKGEKKSYTKLRDNKKARDFLKKIKAERMKEKLGIVSKHTKTKSKGKKEPHTDFKDLPSDFDFSHDSESNKSRFKSGFNALGRLLPSNDFLDVDYSDSEEELKRDERYGGETEVDSNGEPLNVLNCPKYLAQFGISLFKLKDEYKDVWKDNVEKNAKLNLGENYEPLDESLLMKKYSNKATKDSNGDKSTPQQSTETEKFNYRKYFESLEALLEHGFSRSDYVDPSEEQNGSDAPLKSNKANASDSIGSCSAQTKINQGTVSTKLKQTKHSLKKPHGNMKAPSTTLKENKTIGVRKDSQKGIQGTKKCRNVEKLVQKVTETKKSHSENPCSDSITTRDNFSEKSKVKSKAGSVSRLVKSNLYERPYEEVAHSKDKKYRHCKETINRFAKEIKTKVTNEIEKLHKLVEQSEQGINCNGYFKQEPDGVFSKDELNGTKFKNTFFESSPFVKNTDNIKGELDSRKFIPNELQGKKYDQMIKSRKKHQSKLEKHLNFLYGDRQQIKRGVNNNQSKRLKNMLQQQNNCIKRTSTEPTLLADYFQ